MTSPPVPWTPIVITLFPQFFPSTLCTAPLTKARKKNLWDLEVIDLKKFGEGNYNKVDDTPFGGGAGLIIKADPVAKALHTALEYSPKSPCYYLSPRGIPLTQKLVEKIATQTAPILLCGRYEGIDERILQTFPIQEISLGDFILMGGEVAALALLESVLRCRDNVLGDPLSLQEESFRQGLLEYPQYTKPVLWQNQEVPSVLRSGNHKAIALWRQQQAEQLTKKRRPDLWETHIRTLKEKKT